MSKKQKYYVVWRGREPGIFSTWDDCAAQVSGYTAAEYKSFDTLREAREAYQANYADYAGKTKTSLTQVQLRAYGKPIVPSYCVDAACSGNPGPGGWGAILDYNGTRKELSGGEAETTNNRMELTGAIVALESLKRPCKVEMHVDSAYVKDGITKWIHGWKRNGWKTADKKPVKNEDLWQRLEIALKPHKIEWHWVKGHAGHPENERADELARMAIAELRAKKKA